MSTPRRRVFVASVATETNTFSPLRTDLRDFRDSLYAPPGHHPDTPTLCSAVFPVARKLAPDYGWELIEGTAAWAEPGGMIGTECWRFLRDQLLAELRAAMPVDLVLLGLHGAMVAQDCFDCEGDLLLRVREIVGPDILVGATLDPHSHLSRKRTANADLLIAFKEFPHTDFVETAEALCKLMQRVANGGIDPCISVFDCKMASIFPTNRDPIKSFVQRMRVLETDHESGVLSISAIHGFMAGDVPDMGARIMVITDDNPTYGRALARCLGMEMFNFRGIGEENFLPPEVALEKAIAKLPTMVPAAPVVLADVWDNPGGGVAGDSTILLRQVMQRGIKQVAFATIWDPIAVRVCVSAGVGAQLNLRFGGKMSATGGDPIDAEVVVRNVVKDAVQSFGASIVPLGDSVWIEIDGVHVILNTVRSQVFNPDLFTNMGIDPLTMRMLCVKSTNHFHDAFAPIAADIFYAAVEGLYPSDPRTTVYHNLRREIWPRVAAPHWIPPSEPCKRDD